MKILASLLGLSLITSCLFAPTYGQAKSEKTEREIGRSETPTTGNEDVTQAFLGEINNPSSEDCKDDVRSFEIANGYIAFYEHNGAIHIILTKIDKVDPTSEDQGIALAITVTQDGGTLTQSNPNLLAKLVHKENIAATLPEQVVVTDCKSDGTTTCCIVATDTKFCQCCVVNRAPKCWCVEF